MHHRTTLKIFNEVKRSKIAYQEVIYFRSEKGNLCTLWKYKEVRKPVVLVLSKNSNGIADIISKQGKVTTIPTLIYEYNQSMIGCDCLDQLVRCYNNFGQTTVK